MKKKGIVVATHPSDHSVDVLLSDGRRLVGVQVMTPNGSARSGVFDMPAVPERGGDKWDISEPNGQDQIAIVDFVDGIPLVAGFLYPQISQMTFGDPKLRVTRHQSDVMTAIDSDGNVQITHPSGTYIRLGEQPDKVDLSAANSDESLAIDRNTDRRVHVRIGMADGVLELTMTPSGEVLLICDKNINFQTKENIRMEAGKSIQFMAPAGMTFATPNGHFTARSTAAVDFVAGPGISLVKHKHPGVVIGPDKTEKPTIDDDSLGPPWRGINFPTA